MIYACCSEARAVRPGGRLGEAHSLTSVGFRLEVAGSGRFVAHCRLARNVWERFRGLMLVPPLRPGEALWLPACGAVHTALLQGPVDLLFLKGDRVLAVRRRVPPWRVAACRGAASVLELAAGEIERLGLAPGQRLLGLPVPTSVPVDYPSATRHGGRRRG